MICTDCKIGWRTVRPAGSVGSHEESHVELCTRHAMVDRLAAEVRKHQGVSTTAIELSKEYDSASTSKGKP